MIRRDDVISAGVGLAYGLALGLGFVHQLG